MIVFLRDLSAAQNFFQGLAFSKFIDKLIKPANLLHQRVVDGFYFDAANAAFDEGALGLICGASRKKVP